MVGIHYELTFGQEGVCCDGMLRFTVYGPALEETKAWGEKQAWDHVHEKRPTRRALKSLRSAPVADYLLTDEGKQPLDFEKVRTSQEERRVDELRAFGLGSNGYVEKRKNKSSPTSASSEWGQAISLEELRQEMEARFPLGTKEHAHFLQETNWDPARKALYLVTVTGEDRGAWSEAVLCSAVNFFQVGRLWAWHCRKEWGELRAAGFGLMTNFCVVGEPLFRRRKKRLPPSRP